MKINQSLAVVALSLAITIIRAVAQPANDNFANRIPLETTNIAVTASLVGSTIEPGETPPATGSNNDIIADRSVWYSWAAPATGRAYFTTTPHWVSQFVVPYTGTSLANLQRVPLVIYASNKTFLTQEGTVYHFQVGSYSPNGETDAAFNLELRPEVPADNDLFSSAIPLRGNPWYTDGPMPPLHWLLGATTELGEPAHLGVTPAKSLWWKWQAPYYGQLNVNSTISTATNVMIGIYQGSTLPTLKLLKKGTNSAGISVIAGEDYYIATAVPTNATGDVFLSGGASAQSTFHPVPGNVLLNPSFEQGELFDYWSVSGNFGGFVGENGGADGRSWPVLGPGTKIWQEFTTVPGHRYRIRFIWRFGGDLSGGGGARSFRVLWDTNEVGIAHIPADEPYWHCPTFYATASNTTSRFTLENLGGNTDVDGCSVVDVTAAPEIVTQPKSLSTVAGGSAGFVVGVNGSEPLIYQWFFNGSALSGATTRLLELQSVSTNQIGQYYATVSNGFGAVTSAIANLIVEAPDAPVILYQPNGESVAVGAFVSLSVVAGGTPPLQYQWFYNDEPMTGFTNRFVTFDSIQLTNAGVYRVLVQNNAGSALTLPATIQVSGTNVGGAMIDFRNRAGISPGSSNAPVFNIDGFTPLNGSNFVAQLYAGPSLAALRPAGQPTPFYSGFSAGYFMPKVVTLPNIAPGSNVVVQVRAWEQSKGLSYEEARALGGKYGKSGILNLTTSPPQVPPTRLLGLQSFSLQAGLPFFSVGIIRMVGREPGNILVWALDGEPNSRYVIEKAVKDFDWEPFVVVTNVTGTVTFSDTANSGANNVFFRARILD